MDVLYVVHADIGEAQRGNNTHKQLLEIGVYFYSARYFPPTARSGYGCLESIPLPGFQDPEWPLPDMVTSECFRSRFRNDFQVSMKPSVGSKVTHINWFLPIHVMVDLFAPAEVYRTPSMFVFKQLNEESFSSLMDCGWDSKICVGMDIIKCIVDRSTVIFRYHIGRSTLYVNFQYNRQRLLQASEWENLEQVQSDEMVKICCQVINREENFELEVGSKWTLASVRQEILIALGSDIEDEFCIGISDPGGYIREKVGVRNEKNRTVADVMPPRILKISHERT
jgi:hypothetical protein